MSKHRDAFRFFHEQAGYVVGLRAEGALALARAESLLEIAVDLGVASLEWEGEDEHYLDVYGDLDGDGGGKVRERFETGEWTGPYWASLEVYGDSRAAIGMVVFGPEDMRDPYRRVIEAELALEASDDLRQAIGDALDSQRPADEDLCGGRNTLTRHANGDLVSGI